VATKQLDGRPFSIIVRSYREIRRFRAFGEDPSTDLMFRWLRSLRHCSTFIDIGASIGIYGFGAHHLYGAHVIFVEPYAPSAESLLKSIVVQGDHTSFELVQAAIDASPRYAKLYLHGPPKPGETKNSFAEPELYTHGGRTEDPVYASQWLPSVSLDHLVHDLGFKCPDHLKMDVDGFECEALKGCRRVLQNRSLVSAAIEVNGDENARSVRDLFRGAGYREVAKQVHHPDDDYLVEDIVFLRNGEQDLAL
jgi:FkbM family methyltransferase